MIAALVIAAGCGGGTSRPAATTIASVAAGVTATLEGEVFVAVRMLPAAALSSDQLEAAGMATAADGSRISMARADTADAAPWELVSVTADGWRVWRPKAVLDVLATAGAGASLVGVEQVSWPDACLGAARPGEVCAQVITPGYRVILEQDGQRIEYHTSRAGGARLAPSP
jgi:hypothetical protein